MTVRCAEEQDSTNSSGDLELDKLLDGLQNDLKESISPEEAAELEKLLPDSSGNESIPDSKLDSENVQDFMDELTDLMNNGEVKDLLEAKSEDLDDTLREQQKELQDA
jgi:hypothetical protein